MIEKEIELSRKIQMALMPSKFPEINGFKINSFFHPSGLVAGDMYDVVTIGDGQLAIYILDVAGRGVSTALISSVAKASFAQHIPNLSSPVPLLNRVNNEIVSKIGKGTFVRAFACYVNLHNNKMCYANAGHTAPILIKGNGAESEILKSTGKFIGFFDDLEIEEKVIDLQQEDNLLCFTDGFYQLWNSTNELEGFRSFNRYLDQFRGDFPETFLELIQNKVNAYTDKNRLNDDMSLILINVQTRSQILQLRIDMGFEESDPVFLQYLSYYEEIDSVASNILRDMDNSGFSDEIIRKMKLSITELIANAICHGNKENHSKKVAVGHLITSKSVLIAIKDDGAGFDIATVADPTLPENIVKDHGRGIYIVKNYVDEITYNSIGNCVLIRKFRK